MALQPEKMDELKEKYGITDDAIHEIADSLEPEAEAPEFPTVGNRAAPQAPAQGGLPMSLASAMRGDISIAEAIILMDYLDRKEDRRDRRTAPAQGTDSIGRLIEEMRAERKQYQENIEKLILGRRAEDAEVKAREAEEKAKRLEEAQRQREATEAAVKTAVGEVEQRYGKELDRLAAQFSQMTPKQQKGFFDEIAEELGTEMKNQFKDMITSRLQPPKEPVVKADDQGKPIIDWGNAVDRLFSLGDKYIEAQKGKPQLQPVQPVPLEGGVPPPLGEAPPEPQGGTPPQPPEETQAPAPQPPWPPINDIVGIGPAREKALHEMGITNAHQLAKLSPKHLAESLKVSRETAEDIIKQARDRVDEA